MNEINKIQLKSACILNMPFQVYDEDFCFIVNNEEFKTSRFISDLLSPQISKMHSMDPTFDSFTINTHYHGNFSYILDLINFQQNNIPENEFPFISEVIKILDNKYIEITEPNQPTQFTIESAIKSIQKHEKNSEFYSNRLKEEIEFISGHFYEIENDQKEELSKIELDTLIQIIENPKLLIKSEDQLLQIINSLYSNDKKYSILYENVCFIYVTTSIIKEFISIFDFNDMTNSMWNLLCERLEKEIDENNENRRKRRK